jgi:hypothetical protein
MKYPIYTPILKTKRGEAKALIQLEDQLKKSIIPFFDILALKTESSNGSEVQEHIVKQAINIISAWNLNGPCYVDLFDVTPTARGINGAHPATIVYEKLASNLVEVIPVVGIERDIAYKLAVRNVITSGAAALAIRLDTEDIQLPSMLVERITRLVAEIGATALPLHIFLDFRSIEKIASDTIQMQVTKAMGELRKLKPARVVFSASAMVSNMGNYKKETLNVLPRRDFLIWELISKVHPDVDYSDYGVVHPDYFDFDPRVIKPAAKIRYTSDKEWIIVKGIRWQSDTSQHHRLSKMLRSKSQFRGDDSWGGEYIVSASNGRQKYGTLETWVTIDQNNHITHTVRQLSSITTLKAFESSN